MNDAALVTGFFFFAVGWRLGFNEEQMDSIISQILQCEWKHWQFDISYDDGLVWL